MEYGHVQKQMYDFLLFDLDDTLYPLSAGLATSLLKNIKGNWIFTNANKVHAVKVVNELGLEGCFERILCFETLNPTHKSTPLDNEDDMEFVGSTKASNTTTNNNGYEIFDIIAHFSRQNYGSALPKTPIVCKPSKVAIERALKIANIDPHKTVFFEDSVRNIQAGKCVGLDTALVGNSQRIVGADYTLESIHNIREAIPEFWEVDKLDEIKFSGVAVETSVTT